MSNEKSELKDKVARLFADLNQKDMCVKAFDHNV